MTASKTTPLTEDSDSIVRRPILVHVIAPASLPEGYTYEAEINGNPEKTVTVKVPEGGVEEGQMFLVPLPELYKDIHLKIPTGHWKDGIFDCIKYGICHASLCCSLWCTQIAMGQTISRLQLTWLGEPGHITKTTQAFMVICLLVGCFYTYSIALTLASVPYQIDDNIQEPSFIPAMKFIGNFLFTVWAIYSLCKARETVRARYQIPEERCKGCEDVCCSFWCSCCTAAQLLRHTGQYETYIGVCCSSTGHEPGTPITV